MVSLKEKQYKRMIDKYAMFAIEVNLSKNTVLKDSVKIEDGKEVNLSEVMGVELPISLDEFSERWIEQYLDEVDDYYALFMTSKHLFRCYDKGNCEPWYEFWLVDEKNCRRYVRQNFVIDKNEEDGDVYAFSYVIDITNEKDQRERVQNQREVILGLIKEYKAVYLTNLDTNIVEIHSCKFNINESVEYCAKDIKHIEDDIQKYREEKIVPEDVAIFDEAITTSNIRKELETKESFSVDYRTFGEDDEIAYSRMKVMKVGRGGRVDRVLIGIKNVDEEIKAEAKQKKALKDALRKAETASKAKSMFLTNMSHDIRTPMNAIIGFTTLALMHPENTEHVQEYLRKISVSSNHLLSLINDILDMSKIEVGQICLEEAECSLSEVMHEIKDIVQNQIASKALEFSVDTIDITDEYVYCDRLRVSQMLLNLLDNAIKFSKPGGKVMLGIRQLSTDDNNRGTYEFTVKDDGVGISPDFLEHIFEPFEREKNSTNSGISGTGLGLAISKNIVDMMNGAIIAKSEVGKGSEFIITLEFKVERNREKVEQAIKELEGMRALVIDDNFDNCESISKMLTQIGMRADWTISGKEAFMRIKVAEKTKDKYNMFFVDWQMPDMDGIEIAKKIRAEQGEDVPIIILSAYDWIDIEEKAKGIGVTTFLSKPIFMTELRSVLHSIIKQNEYKTDSGLAIDEVSLRDEHKGKTILIVEDNILNLEIAKELITDAGLNVQTALNGFEALKKVMKSEAGDIDLILMDIQMPVMNGYDTTKAIRTLEKEGLAKIPIVAMTADAFDSDKKKAFESGMNEHISKPINLTRLYEVINRQLGE